MNYFNWILDYADWIDSIIAENEESTNNIHGTE